MSDTFIPPATDPDSVDHTDDVPAAAGAAVSPAPAASAPVDDRSDAEKALAPAPADDPGPQEPAVAEAPAPVTEAPANTPAGSAPGDVVDQADAGDPDAGVTLVDLVNVLTELVRLLDETTTKVDQLDGKVDGLVDDVATAKAALVEFQQKAPSMLGGLGAMLKGGGN